MLYKNIWAICTESHIKHHYALAAERSIVESQIWFYVK